MIPSEARILRLRPSSWRWSSRFVSFPPLPLHVGMAYRSDRRTGKEVGGAICRIAILCGRSLSVRFGCHTSRAGRHAYRLSGRVNTWSFHWKPSPNLPRLLWLDKIAAIFGIGLSWWSEAPQSECDLFWVGGGVHDDFRYVGAPRPATPCSATRTASRRSNLPTRWEWNDPRRQPPL